MQQVRQLIHANSNCKMLCFWGVADLLGKAIECLHMISSHACSWCRSDCLVQLGPSSLDAILFGLDQPLYYSLLIFTCCTSSILFRFSFLVLSVSMALSDDISLYQLQRAFACNFTPCAWRSRALQLTSHSATQIDATLFDQKFGYQNHRDHH